MLQTRGADPRLYNPDRDLIWAMPRLLSAAFHAMGKDITVEDLRVLMKERKISSATSDDNLYKEFETFVQDIAAYLNALKDDAAVRKQPEEWFSKLFATGNRAGIRALVADFLMCAMFAELPVWFASVQPDQANSPLPNIEEIQRAVESVLGRRSAGEVAADA